jgi:hypothetical protein
MSHQVVVPVHHRKALQNKSLMRIVFKTLWFMSHVKPGLPIYRVSRGKKLLQLTNQSFDSSIFSCQSSFGVFGSLDKIHDKIDGLVDVAKYIYDAALHRLLKYKRHDKAMLETDPYFSLRVSRESNVRHDAKIVDTALEVS